MRLKTETKDDNTTLYWVESDSGLRMTDKYWSPEALLKNVRATQTDRENELMELEGKVDRLKSIVTDYDDAIGDLRDIIAAHKTAPDQTKCPLIRDDETFLYTDDDGVRAWRLPHIVKVEGKPNPHSYRVIGYGPPQAGQYYLPGANIRVYLATSNMDHDYLIVELGKAYRQVKAWEPVE